MAAAVAEHLQREGGGGSCIAHQQSCSQQQQQHGLVSPSKSSSQGQIGQRRRWCHDETGGAAACITNWCVRYFDVVVASGV